MEAAAQSEVAAAAVAAQPVAAAAAALDSIRPAPSRRPAPPARQAAAAVAVAAEVDKDPAVTRPAQAAAAPWWTSQLGKQRDGAQWSANEGTGGRQVGAGAVQVEDANVVAQNESE